MGWERYLLQDFFTAREFDDLESRLRLQRSSDRASQRNSKARIEALEADLGRVALLTRALAEACLSKGVMTRDELAQLLLQADLADGKRDEKLQAGVVMPGESKAADPEPNLSEERKSKLKRRRPYL